MMGAIGIIGGSALARFPGLAGSYDTRVDTSYGSPSGPVTCGQLAGRDVCCVARHGPDNRIAPHRINYRANLAALSELGCESIISFVGVGGIRPDWAPGRVVVPDQIIDYTWGREHTFYDGNQQVAGDYIDFTEPYSRSVRAALMDAAAQNDIRAVDGGVYGVCQGRRLETLAEINRMAANGCDIVGLTGMPEAALARELGMPYGCLAIVINTAAGRDDEDAVHGSVQTRLASATEAAESILAAAVALL